MCIPTYTEPAFRYICTICFQFESDQRFGTRTVADMMFILLLLLLMYNRFITTVVTECSV